ncbi:uncharacterized protein LOC133309735 [Gastrolobium bilobum]|uniref:uncharacterized protein LOC133309735 n=1 Tax=Gastrolobium bilobum TaxID=150636 RepID=UPI002AAFEBE3|nr:uncharacterized protein LOC133309735 [Gastrolobium bilobum]
MKKGLSLAFLVMLIHLHLSGATTSWKVVNGNHHKGCVGGAAVEDCLIGKDLESEFSLGSHTARMLYDFSQSVTGRSGNSNGGSVNCPQSRGYRSCLPSQNGGGPRQQCGDYTRTC